MLISQQRFLLETVQLFFLLLLSTGFASRGRPFRTGRPRERTLEEMIQALSCTPEDGSSPGSGPDRGWDTE